jgi:hypothetical protein
LRSTVLAALAAATLLLAGCGGDDEPEAGPTSSPTDTASTATDPTPTEPAEPTVEPATGPLIDRDRIRMNVPEGWRKSRQIATFLESAGDPDSDSTVSLGDLSAVGDPTLRELAEASTGSRPDVRFEKPVEIAGVEWYRATGREGRYARFEQYGTIHNGSQATINFSLDDDVPRAEQQEIIDSVLASVEWK